MVRGAEDFQGLVLGRGRKGEVAGVGEQLAQLHQTVDLILIGLLLALLADLGGLFDGVANLLVENPPVGDHDDRIKDRSGVFCQPDQLMGQPGNGIALAAARRVLD